MLEEYALDEPRRIGSNLMSAFSRLAEMTIRTSPDGRRILALHGPRARPYDVSGPDTEERVVRRLACAYRALLIPTLALVLLVYRWPNRYTVIAGLAVTAVVGWSIVWAMLYPDLRRLKRVARPIRKRESSADFIRQLSSSDRAQLLRRRRFLVTSCVITCFCAAFGVSTTLDGWRFGYAIAAFSGYAGAYWWRMALLAPEAVLEMPNIVGFWASNDLEADTRSSELRDRMAAAVPNSKPLHVQSAVWDRELDGGTTSKTKHPQN
jgi:hypothetical protein